MDIKNSINIGMSLLRQNPDKKSGDMLQIMMNDAVVDMATKSEHGEKFISRKKGAIGKVQAHINDLVAAHPTLTSKEIMRLADKNIIGEIKVANFSNKVTKARNPKN
jgi:hypothetical protein